MAITYRDAGVDIDAGAELVEQLKPLAAQTARREVLAGIGGFAGLCGLPDGYRDPVLVSGCDGVGTKLKTACAVGRHDTIGIDLVAMAANDVAVTGAEPLFFLDYFATPRLDVTIAREVLGGVARGCREAGCALLGGETAELPGMLAAHHYDVAGFCVGVVERDEIRDGRGMREGDAIVGLPSSGLHSNGHSLARRALLEELGFALFDKPPELGGATIADELLRPTVIYVSALARLNRAKVGYRAAAHITGGGLVENCPRVLPGSELAVALDPTTWSLPPVFDLIASAGIEGGEMRRTFNLGIGLAIFCPRPTIDAILRLLDGARVIGEVVARRGGDACRFH